MPTYEYVCRACEHEFEAFQKISAKPLRTCPECGADSAERRISSGAGLLFKGSGFYATDYRDSPPAEKKRDGEAEGKSGSGADDSGDGGSGGEGKGRGSREEADG